MITAKLLLAYILQTMDVTGLTIDTASINPQEAYCLAENIFYEARGESTKGQIAVASVTMNRANDPRYPKTVCGVVSQTARSKISNGITCAFSWYCDQLKNGKELSVKNSDGSVNEKVVDQFNRASVVAVAMLGGGLSDVTRGATHFHNHFLSAPVWSSVMTKTVSIGNHTFYK